MEVRRERGEEAKGGERTGVVEHVAAAARRPDERQDLAGEPLVERALERDLAGVGPRDGEQRRPVGRRLAERGMVVHEGLPAEAMRQEPETVDRARAHRVGEECGELGLQLGRVNGTDVRGRRCERVDVELDEVEGSPTSSRLGRDGPADVGVLLRHEDDADTALALEVGDQRPIHRQLARQQRDGHRERPVLRAAADDQDRGEQPGDTAGHGVA